MIKSHAMCVLQLRAHMHARIRYTGEQVADYNSTTCNNTNACIDINQLQVLAME